jgi:DNA-binding CsgD family transcriptional regulator
VLATGDRSCRLVLRFLPLSARGDEVFNSAVAICAVTVWRIPEAPPPAVVGALAVSFGLTPSEARVAAMVGLGVDLAACAKSMAIGIGTARNYLKSAQAKIGLSRQAELASLVSRLWA